LGFSSGVFRTVCSALYDYLRRTVGDCSDSGWLTMHQVPCHSRVRLLSRLVAPVALIITLLLGAPVGLVRAQIDPQVRDRVVPAVVEIAIIFDVTENGTTESQFLPVGSGTIISPDGLILTNHHVIDMAAHREQLDAWEAQAASDGDPLSFALDDGRTLILITDGVSAPEPAYIADVVAEDRVLDLAILRITGDEFGASTGDTGALPFAPLGDSSTVRQGDPIDLFGYPMIGGDTLTYTNGVVSGFNYEEGVDGPAWITTNATMAGGSSGGTALDRAGRLIGIPTQGTELDCRPGDTNRDGTINAEDVGCIPLGGSIGLLRPINLAASLLEQAGVTIAAPVELPEHLPEPTPGPAPVPTSAPSTVSAEGDQCVCAEAACPIGTWDLPSIPHALSVSRNGTVFVANGNSITAITPDGDILRDWAVNSPDQQESHSVRDIAGAADGRVFALVELSPAEERGEERGEVPAGDPGAVPAGFKPLGAPPRDFVVEVFDANGKYAGEWDEPNGGGRRLSNPIALDIAPDGTVSILDAGGSIKRFTSNGGFIEWLSRDALDALDSDDVAGAPDGSLYVLDSADWRIESYALDGAFVLQWGQSGGGAGELIAPTAIAVGPDASVYVADEADGRVQRFTSDGDFLAEWVVGDPMTVVDVGVGPAGMVYVASTRTDTVDAYCVPDLETAHAMLAQSGVDQPPSTTSTVAVPESVFALPDAASCTTGAIYSVGVTLSVMTDAVLRVSPGDTQERVLAGTEVQTTGPYVEAGACDLWPVEVVSIPRIPGTEPYDVSEPGTQGLIDERVLGSNDADGDGRRTREPVRCVAGEPEYAPSLVLRYESLLGSQDVAPCDPTR
jgi:S1-C subfamily serine protease